MSCPTCGARIEVTVPLWLSLGSDGRWTVYGIGAEDSAFYCANSHPLKVTDLTTRDHDNLVDTLREYEARLDAEVPA